MNLTDEEESALFWRTEDITSIDVLDWIAERVIEGYELWRCEECDGSGRLYEDGVYGSCDECESHGFVLAEDGTEDDEPGE